MLQDSEATAPPKRIRFRAGRTGSSARIRNLSQKSARLIVFLRFLILPAWIAGTVLAVSHLPSVFDSESGELGSLLPHSSKALEVERKAIDSFGLPLLSRTIVVAHQPQGFTPQRLTATSRYIAATDQAEGPEAIRAVPLLDAPGLLAARQSGTTLVTYLYIDPSLAESDQQLAAERFATGLKRASGATRTELTGVLPATRAKRTSPIATSSGSSWQPCCWSSASSPSTSARSGFPLLGLGAVGVAYLVADRVLGWIAEAFGLSIPREVEPVIIALIFGVLTDYLVFFVSGFRQRLLEGRPSREAVDGVTAELLPVILTAALMIAGATMTLLLSGVASSPPSGRHGRSPSWSRRRSR